MDIVQRAHERGGGAPTLLLGPRDDGGAVAALAETDGKRQPQPLSVLRVGIRSFAVSEPGANAPRVADGKKHVEGIVVDLGPDDRGEGVFTALRQQPAQRRSQRVLKRGG